MADEFLKYDKGTGKIVFTDPAYSLVIGFRELLNNREGKTITNGNVEDSLAMAEFGVIWWINSYKSPGVKRGQSEEDLIKNAKLQFGLPNTWEPDVVYLNAERVFIEGFVPIEVEVVVTLRSALNTANKIVKVLDRKNRQIIARGNLTDTELETIVGNQNLLLGMASKIPSQIESLQAAEANIKAEKLGTKLAYGKKVITDSMRKSSNKEIEIINQ